MIDGLLRDAAWSYRALMVGYGALCAAIAALLAWAHFTVATGRVSDIVHAEYLLAYTHAPTPLLATYAVVIAVLVAVAVHAAVTFTALAPVVRSGSVSAEPWQARLFPSRAAQRTLLGVRLPRWAAPLVAALPQHAQWVAAMGVAYTPLGAYWASVLMHHDLHVLHVWWLVLGAPGIVTAHLLALSAGDAMLRDAANLAGLKYRSKTA